MKVVSGGLSLLVRIFGRRILYPREKTFEVTLACFEKPGEQGVALICIDIEPPTVETQKDVCREERDSLVAIHECMVHE